MGKFELAKLLIGAWTFQNKSSNHTQALNRHYKIQTV